MKIELHKNFEKAFSRLDFKQKQRVREVLDLFRKDPFNPLLKNHILHGEFQEYRAISAGGNLRLIFQTIDNFDTVQFLNVGTHNQVY